MVRWVDATRTIQALDAGSICNAQPVQGHNDVDRTTALQGIHAHYQALGGLRGAYDDKTQSRATSAIVWFFFKFPDRLILE